MVSLSEVYQRDYSDNLYKDQYLLYSDKINHLKKMFLQEGRLTTYKGHACSTEYMEEQKLPFTTLLSKCFLVQ